MNRPEDMECHNLVAYMKVRGLVFSHLPTSTYTPYWGIKVKNQRLGVVAGVPDYIVIIPSNKRKDRLQSNLLLFIEMKKKKGGVLSPSQDFRLKMINHSGIRAERCNGFLEARKLLEEYI